MNTTWLRALLVTAVVIAAATSCGGDDFSSQSTKPDASGDAGQGDSATQDVATTCAIQTTLAPCDECINANCLDSCQACAGNTGCQDIVNCVIANCVTESGAPDPTCTEDCVKAHPSGLATFGAFWRGFSPGCVSSECASTCPW